MKKFTKILLVSILGVFLVAGSAMAIPWQPPAVALQDVLDDITTLPNPGNSSVDVTTDYLADTGDSYWSITAVGGSLSTMIIELAGFKENNLFGVYSGGQYVELFAGGNVAGDQAVLSIKDDGSVYVNLGDTGTDFAGNNFGYYLDSSHYANGGLFHSDTSLNTADGFDHMFAYQGTNTDTVKLPDLAAGLWTNNEYILAFEDLDGSGIPGSDWDFTDMVVMVESVNPVPEPATMLLFGTGMLGLALISRKKFFK